MTKGKSIPGSSKKGDIDTRSTDANGKQADEVKPHSERAGETPSKKSPRQGEVGGALKDQVGH
ncbi:hypothetical protein EJV46_18715 [Roseococcus sp. SYP-B2431]|uniref:hypothetical protein n=1 Tax=Roseococcus sp. SYP-B2431 TaxID=2496640 RepID=UPI00103C9F30|nr:hypothetical protein [Roseococcus sp. SYP-B2431]TCH96621.1 hypothetical protein EJV46_18715 [Roseococcus sp. SYP-B2431]